jgi:WD40 repeat protein
MMFIFPTWFTTSGKTVAQLDPQSGSWLGVLAGDEVYAVDVGDRELGAPRLLGRHSGAKLNISCDPLDRYVATGGGDGEFRFWSLTEGQPPITFRGPPDWRSFWFTVDGNLFQAGVPTTGDWVSWVWKLDEGEPQLIQRANVGGIGGRAWNWDADGQNVGRYGPGQTQYRIWPMGQPADADPIELHRGDIQEVSYMVFRPQGRWLATADLAGVALWPLARGYPSILRRHERGVTGLAFETDGKWLASSSVDGTIRLSPLDRRPSAAVRTVLDQGSDLDEFYGLAVSPDGGWILASGGVRGGGGLGPLLLQPSAGSPFRLKGFTSQAWGVAFSEDGRLAAAAGGHWLPSERQIRVWDVTSGQEVAVLEVGDVPNVFSLQFISDGRLLSASRSGLLRWNVENGQREVLYEGNIRHFAASADGRRVLMAESEGHAGLAGRPVLLEFDSNIVTRLDNFGDDVTAVAVDREGTIAVTGHQDGEVRIGRLSDEKPHLFLGHEDTVWSLAVDPVGRWVASGGPDTTIRLWPMPDLSKPPLHTLPREELIAKLKTLTNLRAVRDEESSTGWKIEVGPFPGWAEVPEW